MKWINSKRDHSFMRDLPTEGAAHNLRSTFSCNHAIHPAIHHFFDGHPACPVCLSERSVAALERVEWTIEPFHEVRQISSDSTLFMKWALGELRKIRRYEKLHWTKLVTEFERLSAIEAAWEAANALNPDASSQYTAEEWAAKKSATQALGVLWKKDLPGGVLKTPVPEQPLDKSPSMVQNSHLSEESCAMQSSQSGLLDFESRLRSGLVNNVRDCVFLRASYSSESASQTSSQTSSAPYSSPHAKKSVTWAPDLLDDPSRHRMLFERRNHRYSPGRYACPSPEGWENTSWLRDRKWFADRGFRDEEDEKQDNSDSSDDSDDSDDSDGSDEQEKEHESANTREGQDDADSVEKGSGFDHPRTGRLEVNSDNGDGVQGKDQSEDRSTQTTGPSIGSNDVTGNIVHTAQAASLRLRQRVRLGRLRLAPRLRLARLRLARHRLGRPSVEQPGEAYDVLTQFNRPPFLPDDADDRRSRQRAPPESDDGDLSP